MTSAGSPDVRASAPDPAALLTMLTTEHFVLQGARANTVSESTARAALYVGSLSASLVALGLLSQSGRGGSAFDTFDIFVLVVLPTLYAIGTFTFVRLAESSIEDLTYGRAINRIRGYYRELAGPDDRYFALTGHDDVAGVLANMGIVQPSRWQLWFTLASMIETLNGVVGACAVGFAAGRLALPLAGACAVGAAAGIVSIVVSQTWQRRVHVQADERTEVLFPSAA